MVVTERAPTTKWPARPLGDQPHRHRRVWRQFWHAAPHSRGAAPSTMNGSTECPLAVSGRAPCSGRTHRRRQRQRSRPVRRRRSWRCSRRSSDEARSKSSSMTSPTTTRSRVVETSWNGRCRPSAATSPWPPSSSPPPPLPPPPRRRRPRRRRPYRLHRRLGGPPSPSPPLSPPPPLAPPPRRRHHSPRLRLRRPCRGRLPLRPRHHCLAAAARCRCAAVAAVAGSNGSCADGATFPEYPGVMMGSPPGWNAWPARCAGDRAGLGAPRSRHARAARRAECAAPRAVGVLDLKLC